MAEERHGFGFEGLFGNDIILWFIILFLLLFWCYCGFGNKVDVC